jgi:hypothetical protein
MNVRLIILPAILLLVSLSFDRPAADVAPNPMTGGHPIGPYTGDSTSVRMVDEDVAVRIFADSIVTVASFSMHNEGEEVTMDVGFPFIYPGDLMEFRAFVNDRRVEVRDGKKEHMGRKKTTVYWKLWTMSFHRDERCTIRVEYRTKPMLMGAGDFKRAVHATLKSDVREALQRVSTTGIVEYLLYTGKQWKGVLDRCRISFELVGLSGAHVKEFWPTDGVVQEDRVVWDYTHYEPEGHVAIRYCWYMPIKEIPPFLCGMLEQYPNNASLASDIGSFLASDFRRGDLQREIYHSFLARWNEPIPQLMEYASGGRCRFNYYAGNQFYEVWRMASMLFDDYRRAGELEKVRDIAPMVSRIAGALVDSLETCELPEQDVPLDRKAKELLATANALIETPLISK